MKKKSEKFRTSYLSDAKSSYFVVEVNNDEQFFDHQLKLLSKNPVHSILPFKLINKEDRTFIYYNITSKQALFKTLIRKKLSRNEFIKILAEICKIILKSDNYLLDDSNFLVNDRSIYVNPSTLEVSLVYIPVKVEMEGINSQIRTFANKLILSLEANQNDTGAFVHKLMIEINKDDFSVKNLLDFLVKKMFESKAQNTNAARGYIQEMDDAEEVNRQAKQDPEKDNMWHNRKKEAIKHVKEKKKTEKAGKKHMNTEEVDIESFYETTVDILKKKKIIFALIQLLILIAVLLIAMETDIYFNEIGKIDFTSVAATFLLVGAVSVLAYRKIFTTGEVVSGETVASKKVNAKELKQKSKPQNQKKQEFTKHKEVRFEEPRKERVRQEVDASAFATVLLDVEPEQIATLTYLRVGSKETIIIDKNPFVLGKMQDRVDYAVANNAVSRIHAEIYFEDGNYYIEDLNSKNGTRHNGRKIDSNKKYRMSDGDVIKIASEEFRFSF